MASARLLATRDLERLPPTGVGFAGRLTHRTAPMDLHDRDDGADEQRAARRRAGCGAAWVWELDGGSIAMATQPGVVRRSLAQARPRARSRASVAARPRSRPSPMRSLRSSTAIIGFQIVRTSEIVWGALAEQNDGKRERCPGCSADGQALYVKGTSAAEGTQILACRCHRRGQKSRPFQDRMA